VSARTPASAQFGRRPATVTGIDELGAYRLLRVADPSHGDPQPGQFAMLAAVERWGGSEDGRPYLPRAFSIARRREQELHFLLEDVGPGSRRLCELRAEDRMWLLGPLGRGFTQPPAGRGAILVGGGVGIAPLAILQDSLEAEATVLLGFRDGARARGAALLRDPLVATDDGSSGHHGPVTDLLTARIERDANVVVYGCGPAGMLEGVRAICAKRAVPAELALEAAMACGFGACFGCTVPRRGGGYLRVCVDGPVVDAAELDYVDEHAGALE
jgi:NAD(P)H-flavin reductase